MRRSDCTLFAQIQPIVLVLLLGGLFVSSFYVNCLEHAVGIDVPGHSDPSASIPSATDDADRHGHDHSHAHGHASPNRADSAETDTASEPCHHPGHVPTPAFALGTDCDRCLSLATLSVPERNAGTLALLPQDIGARDPHWSRLDRPPTSFG